jgi:hypothetical protein
LNLIWIEVGLNICISRLYNTKTKVKTQKLFN